MQVLLVMKLCNHDSTTYFWLYIYLTGLPTRPKRYRAKLNACSWKFSHWSFLETQSGKGLVTHSVTAPRYRCAVVVLRMFNFLFDDNRRSKPVRLTRIVHVLFSPVIGPPLLPSTESRCHWTPHLPKSTALTLIWATVKAAPRRSSPCTS